MTVIERLGAIFTTVEWSDADTDAITYKCCNKEIILTTALVSTDEHILRQLYLLYLLCLLV